MAVLDDKTSSTTRIIADIYLVNISSAHPFERVSTADDLLLSRGICKQLLQTKPKKVLAVKWDCPPHGCLKLNVDGASKGNTRMAVGGGIIRDHYGQCIQTFSNSYQQQTNLQAEALALVDGLKMCHNLQVRSMVVEIDSLHLVNILQGSSAPIWSIDPQLRFINSYCAGKEISFKHVFRESNHVADCLTNEGISKPMYVEYDRYTIPQSVKGLVYLDAVGCSNIRLCNP